MLQVELGEWTPGSGELGLVNQVLPDIPQPPCLASWGLPGVCNPSFCDQRHALPDVFNPASASQRE